MIGITKNEFENSLFREDVVEYYLGMSREDIEEKFGEVVARMVGFNQNNCHQCYNLFEHTLRTVADIPSGELSRDDVKLLKIAAFFHDVAKPLIAQNDNNGRLIYIGNAEESAKIAREFLVELSYDEEEIKKICFFILHINDFFMYKDNLPYFLEHHVYFRKISAITVAEKLLENQYDFKKAGLDDVQVKAVSYSLLRDEQWPNFEDEKGEEVTMNPVDMQDIKCKLITLKNDYTPTLKDYKMLLKLSIANYKAQAKRSHQKGKIIATRIEKVRCAAIIEAILPESYRLLEDAIDKYQADGVLTQQLIDITNEFDELVTINKVEQMREENAKNLMNKFKDMKIRLTMKS